MSEEECTRRARTVWPYCGCEECRALSRRQRKLHAAGLLDYPTSEEAWAVIDDCIARGWTGLAISSASGLPFRTVHSWFGDLRRYGRRRKIGPGSALAIVNMGQPTEGSVGAEPARRRLRALSRIGYTLEHMADDSGVRFSTLAELRRGHRCAIVRVAHHHPIVAMYSRLAWRPGPSAHARANAERQGWPSPAAWDDIDDPHATPCADAEAEPLYIDESAVLRRIAGDRVRLTTAESVEVVRRCFHAGWSWSAIERTTGLKPERYITRDMEAS